MGELPEKKTVERMTVKEFADHCNTPLIGGYRLRQHQTHPIDYAGLIAFMGDRLKLDGPPFTTESLADWLIERRRALEASQFDCNDINMEWASAVLLIGSLSDPDGYVASLPAEAGKLFLPETDVLRQIIELEQV